MYGIRRATTQPQGDACDAVDVVRGLPERLDASHP